MNKRNAGFTLIDVIIVIAIIGIASAFAIPTFLDGHQRDDHWQGITNQ